MPKFIKTVDNDIIVIPDSANIELEGAEVLEPNTTDAAGEKHVPLAKVDGNEVVVSVGEVAHPMLDEHFIEKVYLKTDKGFYEKNLKPGTEPEAVFILDEDEKQIMFDITNDLKQKNYEIIYNREEAIKKGITLLEEEDILLILGKGHEDYQIIGHTKYPFDDSEIVKKYLTKKEVN